MQEISKYQRWYEALCAKAKGRKIPAAYTEVHHIVPRSLGGSDDESNLVRLTFREHYLAHLLLTRFHTGDNLRKMRKALWAVALKSSGGRAATGWQVEMAKRAVRDMELEYDDAASLERWRQKKQEKMAVRHAKIGEHNRKIEERSLLEKLNNLDYYSEPDRSHWRSVIFSQFDPRLVAKYAAASPEEIREATFIAQRGRRQYFAVKQQLKAVGWKLP